MYLRERKSHSDTPIGWSSWDLEYAVDYTKQGGRKGKKRWGVKEVKYTAYCQGEDFDDWKCVYGKYELSIYKTVQMRGEGMKLVFERDIPL